MSNFRINEEKEPFRVCVTGACSLVASSILFMIGKGELFGAEQRVILHLLEVPEKIKQLESTALELIDCAFSAIGNNIVCTSDVAIAFRDVDYVFCCASAIGSKAREALFKMQNLDIYKEHGEALEAYASRDVRVIVTASPSNTLALVCMIFAPSIPRMNFTALNHLDVNRTKFQIARVLNTSCGKVENIIVWGNLSKTKVPDCQMAVVKIADRYKKVTALVRDENFLLNDLLTFVRERAMQVKTLTRKKPSLCVARGAVHQVNKWWSGSNPGEIISMSIVSDGSYGVPKDIIFGFPVQICSRQPKIIDTFPINFFIKQQIDLSAQEISDQKREAFKYLGLEMQPESILENIII